ncbi:hypothetical protein MTO96_004228, partial [Rhipicephalus appendiculatus]
YYLLFKSPGTEGNSTSLRLLDRTRYQCVNFWYYMPDLSDGVELYVQGEKIPSSNGTWRHHLERLLEIWDEPIVAVSGLNPKGFVAIDDISVSEEACEACPAYFCQNDGTCRWTALARSPKCECQHGYKGVRCQMRAKIDGEANKLTAKASGSAGAVATGVIVVLAIIIIAVVGAIVVMRKRRMAR